jgi:hypothetical protein
MTTGMRSEATVETRRRRNWNWLWLIPAVIIVLALIGFAQTPKPARTGNNATSESVQNGATGSQGAVGRFAENVQPNEKGGQANGTTAGPLNTIPTSRAQGQGTPAAESTGGTDAGAGNSGITSTQEGLGGAASRGDKSNAPDSSQASSNPNGKRSP